MDPSSISPSGASWLIGLMAVLHFTLVSVGGLGPLTVYLMETVALRKGWPNLAHMARHYLTLALEIGVTGAVLGSGVVVMLIGLRPQVITLIFNIFFWFLVLQLFCFIGGIAFQFAYYFTFEKTPSRHRLWGLVGAILPLVPFTVFSAAVAFLSTPGAWPQTGNVWAAVFNPGMLVSLLHRLAAGASLTGALLMAIHAMQRRGKSGADLEYHSQALDWAAWIARRGLEAQLVVGILRVLVMGNESRQGLFSGVVLVYFVIGIAAGIVAYAYLFLRQRGPRLPSSVPAVLLLALLPVLLTVWMMSLTRSLNRGSFSIVGVMDRMGNIAQLPARYQVADVPSGEAIFGESCGACHPGLAGDAKVKAQQRHPDPAELSTFLRDPGAYNIAMPPYSGGDLETRALVSYLLDIPLEEVPEAAGGPAPAVAVAARTPGEWMVLAWNDLGMHCFMADYSVFQVLPPFNTLWAQVIRRGEKPEVVTEGIIVEYHVPSQTAPEKQTNFWEHAAAYGWDLEPGIGLKGFGVAGEMEAAGDHFVAEGVPLIDRTDEGTWDPFPMFIAEVKDASGKALVDTTNVAPVSSEMRCDICHSSGTSRDLAPMMMGILELHDRDNGTQLAAQAQGGDLVMCAGCHADPALGIMESQGASRSFSASMHSFHADKMDNPGVPENACQACHPGPLTQCQRDAMRGVGITCVNCHGEMVDLADTDRMPWMNLPACESCHTAELGVASVMNIADPNNQLTRGFSSLYRNRTAHGGIYCSACHGSPHAVYPSVSERDNQQSLMWQGEAGPIAKCELCHTTAPEGEFWHFR